MITYKEVVRDIEREETRKKEGYLKKLGLPYIATPSATPEGNCASKRMLVRLRKLHGKRKRMVPKVKGVRFQTTAGDGGGTEKVESPTQGVASENDLPIQQTIQPHKLSSHGRVLRPTKRFFADEDFE